MQMPGDGAETRENGRRVGDADIVFAPAHVLARAIRGREASSVEVLDAYLEQIARHNPRLNAIVTLDEEGARVKVQEADAALGRGEARGALHGVPITLEDAHPTAGMRSTWGGLPCLADHVPAVDGTVAARLKAAGAIPLGKTNGPEIWPDSVFASVNNPWDLARTPGGSSAGPAAALAAGLTPLDVGLDTLGSIQNPAHYCGVYGMRTTEHRVPLTGVFFLDSVRKLRVMSVAGPMARSPADLRLALEILAGPDGLDTHVPPVPWRDFAPPEVRDLRVAWASAFPGSNTQDDISAAVEGVARDLAARGADVEESMPAVDLERQSELGWELFALLADTFSTERGAFSDEPAAASDAGRHSSLEAYLMALERRDEVTRIWDEFFAGRDALLLPAGTRTAERHGEEPTEPSPPGELPYRLSQVSGCPMVVVPAGIDRDGLPFGLQILGRRWSDERLLTIAQLLSEFTPGYQRPPDHQ